jgi:hypothetical protein
MLYYIFFAFFFFLNEFFSFSKREEEEEGQNEKEGLCNACDGACKSGATDRKFCRTVTITADA